MQIIDGVDKNNVQNMEGSFRKMDRVWVECLIIECLIYNIYGILWKII